MKNIFCVYQHIRPDTNEVFYVGIGNILRPNKKVSRNKYWYNIVKSNPNYKIEILFENQTWDFCCQKEIELIKLYGRKDLCQGSLVNMTNGGDGSSGLIASEESKIKRSQTYHNKTNEEKEILRLKNSQSLLGKNKGKKYPSPSKETLLKRSESLKKVVRTKEWCENISKSLRKNPKKPSRKELLESTGKKQTEDHILHVRQANSKGVIQVFKYDTNEFVGEYFCAGEAIKQLKIPNKIHVVLQGKRKHCGGYTFKRIEKTA